MTVAPEHEDRFCAGLSRELGEPLAGTAPSQRGVLVVEQPGPWGRDAVSESGLRPLAAELEAVAATAGLKLLVARKRTRRYDVTAGRHAWVSGFEPGARFLERLDLTDPRELLELPLSAERPTGAGTLEDEPLALACTHSTRDACCARVGLPLARGLHDAGLRTWHVSHLGGHRFAPTFALLPHGLWLGRVDPEVLPEAVAALREDRVPVALLRGRAGLVPAAQVADVAVREATGLDGLDDLVVTGAGARFEVTAADGRGWVATVRHEPTGTVRPVSCGATAKREDPGRWVTDLAHRDAGAGPRLEA